MSWGIASTASEIEKIKAESADYLYGLNSTGILDYDEYKLAFDFYKKLIEKAYELGKSEAYDRLCKEYLSKCDESGCDGCIAEFYCIKNNLRTDRYPQDDCPKKLKDYLRQL